MLIRRSSYEVLDRMRQRFQMFYGEERVRNCMHRFTMLAGRYGIGMYGGDGYKYWDQADVYLITYADMVTKADESPIETLHAFLNEHLRGSINAVHLLPFFPFSSDDGFSVIDYRKVDPALGDWKHIESLSKDYSLMFDLVLNHVSRKSEWFRLYTQNIAPERKYFIEVDPQRDLSSVVRPRTQPLLTEVKTKTGRRHVWTTFSEDQVDLNFANPDVLFEFLDILMQYIAHGARAIRLDAIAYLWKRIGTPCIHLKQTHEVVKLLRDFLEIVAPQVLLLTETNVPHDENISYFGDGDEAQMVYQFTLPPLLLHALLKEDASHLCYWARRLNPPPRGCTFFNFTASHDGIGVRPLEGIVSYADIAELTEHVEKRGGQVSFRSGDDGSENPYELNITYFDALGRDSDNAKLHEARFMCSQYVMLALRGIPAIYFHSLTATPNYIEGVEQSGRARTVNRRKWKLDELNRLINDENSSTGRVFKLYRQALLLRERLKAFHPDGGQEVLDSGDHFFAIVRTSPDYSERVLAISNFSSQAAEFRLPREIARSTDIEQLADVISDQKLPSPKSIAFAPFQTRWIPLTPIAN